MDGVWVDGRRLGTRLQYDLHQYAVRLLDLSSRCGEDPALVDFDFLRDLHWVKDQLEVIESALYDGEENLPAEIVPRVPED